MHTQEQVLLQAHKEERLVESLGESWYNKLKDEFTKIYMHSLVDFIKKQIAIGYTVYPTKSDVFNAYKLTPFEDVRVVIVGQDPYINPFEAHGIAFSTYNGQGTPSLAKIEHAVKRDVYPDNGDYKWNNNLTRWAKQGVLLLNRVLTVNAGYTNSHASQGWENFTYRTIRLLDEKKGVIFLLWGKTAQQARSAINNSVVIECEHPAAASYNERAWENNDCFNKVNKLLTDKAIIW